MLAILRAAKLQPEAELTSLDELDYQGDVPDEEWIAALGKKGGHVTIMRTAIF